MTDLLTALALVLVIEGLVYALAPSLVERVLEALRLMPVETRRLLGPMTADLQVATTLVPEIQAVAETTVAAWSGVLGEGGAEGARQSRGKSQDTPGRIADPASVRRRHYPAPAGWFQPVAGE